MKKLLLLFLLISGMACSQIQIIHFNAGWNSANDVPWFEELEDGKLKWIDIATDAKSQKEYKISVVPTILILVDGEEEERYQADISFSMQATKDEVQEAIDEMIMDQF